MSFVDQLTSIREEAAIEQKILMIEMFNKLKRADRDSMVPKYKEIKDKLLSVIERYPTSTNYTINFPKSVSECMMLLDMLIEDGICNFKINSEGKILSKVMMIDSDNEDLEDSCHEVLNYYTITVSYPFNKSIFE